MGCSVYCLPSVLPNGQQKPWGQTQSRSVAKAGLELTVVKAELGRLELKFPAVVSHLMLGEQEVH